MPSSTAALVAFKASSTLSFLSLTSTSVAPPTLITATPPANLASLS
jgi:Mg2+ and Co2+ transporter CorA